MSDDPVCPDCGENHQSWGMNRELTENERRVVAKKINRLMTVLTTLGPEYTLRIIISMLTLVASKMNYSTRQNVVAAVAEHLEVPVEFGIPPEALRNWRPQGPANSSEVN